MDEAPTGRTAALTRRTLKDHQRANLAPITWATNGPTATATCCSPPPWPNSWLPNYGLLLRNTDWRTTHRLAQPALAITCIMTVKLIDWHDR